MNGHSTETRGDAKPLSRIALNEGVLIDRETVTVRRANRDCSGPDEIRIVTVSGSVPFSAMITPGLEVAESASMVIVSAQDIGSVLGSPGINVMDTAHVPVTRCYRTPPKVTGIPSPLLIVCLVQSQLDLTGATVLRERLHFS
ncbi:MAG: hypothetical protein ACKV19_12980 [Verrucomicrobiales bacterium]